MSQPITLQATNRRSPSRIGQIIFTVLTLLVLALGSLILSLAWFGVGVTITGPGASELRIFAFESVWPVTMLFVWVLSIGALLLARCWLLACLSLPAAFAIMLGVWYLGAVIMITTTGVMFTAVFILLNTGAIWLATWFLRSKSR